MSIPLLSDCIDASPRRSPRCNFFFCSAEVFLMLTPFLRQSPNSVRRDPGRRTRSGVKGERKRKGDAFLHPRIGAARISDAMTPGGFRIPSRAADARAYVRESRRETTQEKVSTTSSLSCPPFLFLSFALSFSLSLSSFRFIPERGICAAPVGAIWTR